MEFLFDFGSPNAYLSHRVIPTIEPRTGIEFEYVPILLGGVFKATNNVSPAVSLQGILEKRSARMRAPGADAITRSPDHEIDLCIWLVGAISRSRSVGETRDRNREIAAARRIACTMSKRRSSRR